MPVMYYSSTGEISFEPVPLRQQAVGPLAVAVAASPPDEIIAPPYNRYGPNSAQSACALALATLMAGTILILVNPVP